MDEIEKIFGPTESYFIHMFSIISIFPTQFSLSDYAAFLEHKPILGNSSVSWDFFFEIL